MGGDAEVRETQESFVEADELFRSFFDNAPIGKCMTTPDGCLARVNPAFCAMLGYTADELQAISFTEITHPDDLAESRECVRSLLAGERDVWCMDKRYLAKDGRVVWANVTTRIQRDAGGRPQYFLTHVVDISVRKQAEAALRASEMRFREVLRNLDEAYYRCTLDGTLEDHNPAFNRILGFDPESDLRGSLLPDFWLHPEKRIAYIDDLSEKGFVKNYLIEARTIRSAKIVVMANSHVVRDDAGRPAWIEGTFTDFTDLKRMEDRERHLNRVLRAIRNVNQLVVREKDAGRLLDQACSMLVETRGYGCAWIALEGKAGEPSGWAHAGWGEAFAPLARSLEAGEWPPCRQEALGSRTGIAVLTPERACAACPIWKHYGHDLALVTMLRHGDSDIGMLGVSFPVDTPVDDEEKGLLAEVGGDIAFALHGMRMEGEHERLTMALEQAAEAIVITDSSGTIQYVNPAFEAITGWSRQEVLGENPRILKSGKQDGAFYAELWATISGGTTWRGRMVNRRKDGSLYTEEASISPVRGRSGAITSFVAVKRDISREIVMEAQISSSQRMDSIGRLAGGVAHDFNNLLSVILSCTTFAIEDLPEGSRAREDLLEVMRAGERAASLTNQLLAFGRRQVLQPEPLDLNRILAETEKMLRRVIGEDVDLVLRLKPGLGLVRADPSQVEQVVMNLAANARDAMPGGGRLTIETDEVEMSEGEASQRVALRAGPHAILVVSDTGTGMDERTAEHAFEPFFTTKESGRGTGLGLSTVYGIVRQSGGDIEVRSEPGKGTSFRIWLPLDRTLEIPEAGDREVRPPSPGTGTILIVEDDEAVRKVARRIVEGAGYSVLVASSGEEALLACARHEGEIRLALTDVIMPGMSGPEFARRLAATRPRTRVIFMSGYTDDRIDHRGVLDPGMMLIGKPFTAEELRRKVHETLTRP